MRKKQSFQHSKLFYLFFSLHYFSKNILHYLFFFVFFLRKTDLLNMFQFVLLLILIVAVFASKPKKLTKFDQLENLKNSRDLKKKAAGRKLRQKHKSPRRVIKNVFFFLLRKFAKNTFSGIEAFFQRI